MQVTYLDHMSSDLGVVNAARVSFSKKSDWDYKCVNGHDRCYGIGDSSCPYCEPKLNTKDTKLINYLAREGHWLPFRHPHVQFHCKAPLFVARQASKSQVGMSWSEVSRRYVDDEPEFFTPEVWRKRAGDKKQGSSDEVVVIKGTEGICPQCKSTFISKGNSQRYCTSACQGKAYKSTNKGWRVSKLERLKASALSRNIPIDLESTDIPMPETCIYLGLTLDYSASSVQDNSPSVDRIDNSRGYTKENIQTISNKANVMKYSASKEELVEFAKSVLALHGGYLVPQVDSVGQFYSEMKSLYNRLIDQGVCPEQARMFMPQSQMTEWHWTGSLLAWAHFIKLRTEGSAQKEIQDFAKMFVPTFEELYPTSWKALMEHL